jgi:hypothetical protein
VYLDSRSITSEELHMRRLLAFSFSALIVGAPQFAAAASIPIAGSGGLGSFTGSIEYLGISDSAAKLIISLTNTSPADNGGFITAFAFNNPNDLINGVTLETANSSFKVIGGAEFDDGISVSPFGASDIGASATNGAWLGGGSPNGGLPVGATGLFTFSFTGSNLLTLTTNSFLNTLSTSGGEFLLVRFRGFEDGGSDKVPARSVPEPTTLVLLGSGLAMIVARQRMRRA